MTACDELVPARVERAMRLTESLIGSLDDGALQLDIPGLPSNAIADQVWCIVGARESYLAAARHGAWQGFGCTLDRETARSQERVLAALRATRAAWGALLAADGVSSFCLAVLEHEVLHHGQLIRYAYANGFAFPDDFARRYALS